MLNMRYIAALLLFLLVVAACSNGNVQIGDNIRIGQSTYERIDSMTDCALLQQEFSRTMTKAKAGQDRKTSLSYAAYADNRMTEIGCYPSGGDNHTALSLQIPRFDSMTDCIPLGDLLVMAMNNADPPPGNIARSVPGGNMSGRGISLAYAEYIDNRMSVLGC